MTSISGEACVQSESGVSVEARKIMSTEFAIHMVADIVEANIRKRIKCYRHQELYDPVVVGTLMQAYELSKKPAYDYHFVFFDIAEPGKKRPFLLTYTVVEKDRYNHGHLNVMVMTMVSDNSILDWHKMKSIPVADTYVVWGDHNPPSVPQPTSGEVVTGRVGFTVTAPPKPVEGATVRILELGGSADKYIYGLHDVCVALVLGGYV